MVSLGGLEPAAQLGSRLAQETALHGGSCSTAPLCGVRSKCSLDVLKSQRRELEKSLVNHTALPD